MFIFLLGIVFAAGLFVTFKLWDKFDVEPFPATVVNYLVSAVVAFFMCSPKPAMATVLGAGWLPYAVALGSISLIDFNLNSFTTKKLGVGVTTISSKLSLLIPVTLAIVLFSETVTSAKIIGVVCAVTALVLISIRKGAGEKGVSSWKKIYYLLPLFVFIGSGTNDFLMLSLGRINTGEGAADTTTVTFVVFTMAFLAGVATFLVGAASGKMKFRMFRIRRNLIGGIGMGLVSVCCFTFYLMGVGRLTEAGWDGSVLASIYAVGVLVLSVLTGIIGFRERFPLLNYIGMGVALAAIAILAAY